MVRLKNEKLRLDEKKETTTGELLRFLVPWY